MKRTILIHFSKETGSPSAWDCEDVFSAVLGFDTGCLSILIAYYYSLCISAQTPGSSGLTNHFIPNVITYVS
jgi:hypothetical protein